MKSDYNHIEIEAKWQKLWRDIELYQTPSLHSDSKKKYILETFPYPSGAGLHVGHTEGYTGSDITVRYARMNGYSVLYPIGFDAFGLPAENFAIKTGKHPRLSTDEAIANFTNQMERLGASYDWNRQVKTHQPEYYKWTQWLFQLMYKQGLAYKKEALVNWDPVDLTVIANEQVLPDGTSERSGAIVEQKLMTQWFFDITKYADRLIDGLEGLDWPNSTKQMQRNWIGRSEGVNITFETDGPATALTIYTTRPDTSFGATFIVVAPDSGWVQDNFDHFEHKDVCTAYIEKTRRKTNLDRLSDNKQKTGEFTGIYGINPFNKEKIPVYLSDFVLTTVGTGAVMGVPGHDLRDFEFAQAKGLDIVRVVISPDGDSSPITTKEQVQEAKGVMTHSQYIDGMNIMDAKEKMKDVVEEQGFGQRVTNYRLRDWSISRQRFWGCPIPVYYDEDGKEHLVPESDLPVMLPDDVEFSPTGRSPLIDHAEFNSRVLKYGEGCVPEVDTMDTFVDSSWYFFRYVDAHNIDAFASKESMKQWLPIDQYIIGAEHSTMHLLYARFFTKVLFDAGYIEFEEPFLKIRHQGMIQGEDGRKMSKRYGNVVNPITVFDEHGADSLRMYEMFMGPFEQAKSWNSGTLKGVRKFLDRVWNMQERILQLDSEHNVVSNSEFMHGPTTERTIDSALHLLNSQITKGITEMSFNTCVSDFMKFVNVVEKTGALLPSQWKHFLLLLAPFAPHITEELWALTNGNNTQTLAPDTSIHSQSWPSYDPSLLIKDAIVLGIQINGKVRSEIELQGDEIEELVRTKVMEDEKVIKWIDGKAVRKFIYIPGRIINIVI